MVELQHPFVKDQYEEAVDDLKTCLAIREAYAGAGLNNRQLAEV